MLFRSNTTYFKENPKESWKLIKEIFYDFFGKAKPNTAHYIIAKWEQKGLVQSIITQNIDNLHQEAGSEKVIEFHGTSQTVTCIACGRQYDSSRFLNMFPPSCPHCKGLLKPDFVFFNEPIPSDTLRKSKEAATKADLFILVGTTGEIMPASRLPYLAEEYNANLVEINIQPSKYTNTITDIFLKGKATRVLTELNNFYNHQLNSKE